MSSASRDHALQVSDLSIEALYDAGTLDRIEAAAAEPATPRPRPRRRLGAGTVVAAIGLGLQEIYEPREPTEVVEVVDEDGLDIGAAYRLHWTENPRTTVAYRA